MTALRAAAHRFWKHRMPRTGFVLLLSLLVLSPAMAAPVHDTLEVSYRQDGRRFGFTFTPPSGSAWTPERLDSGNVQVKWQPDNVADTRLIEAYTITPDLEHPTLPAYIAHVSGKLRNQFGNSPQVTLDQLEVTPHPLGERCVRIHMRLGLRQPAQDGQRQWAEQYTLSCLSAVHDDVGYELRYFHRYNDAYRDAHLEDAAQRVFASVVIQEP